MEKEKLIEWLLGQRYIYWEDGKSFIYGESDSTTSEFEEEHQWELSRNRMIAKTIRFLKEEM